MENERHHTYNMMFLQHVRPDSLTDEVIVRPGPESGVAAVKEGGAEGEGERDPPFGGPARRAFRMQITIRQLHNYN